MEIGWQYCDDVNLVSLQFKNMILYNVTVKIDKTMAADWLHWMLSEHIPAVMGTGQFQSSRISRLLDQPADDDETYVIQYQCESMDHFNYYISTFAGEDTYYESGDARLKRVVELTHKVTKKDPEWMQRFIPWLRGEANIRTLSLIIAAIPLIDRKSVV